MVAFRANRFVCSAIAVITRTTSAICADESLSLVIVRLAWDATFRASRATETASAALREIS